MYSLSISFASDSHKTNLNMREKDSNSMEHAMKILRLIAEGGRDNF